MIGMSNLAFPRQPSHLASRTRRTVGQAADRTRLKSDQHRSNHRFPCQAP